MKEKVDTETELLAIDLSDFCLTIHAANESVKALLEEKNNTYKFSRQLTHVMSISAVVASVPIIINNHQYHGNMLGLEVSFTTSLHYTCTVSVDHMDLDQLYFEVCSYR